MSDHTPGIGHNRSPTLDELVSPATIDTLISAELDREPPSPEGGTVKSIRAREQELIDMCKRFLAAHPAIESDEIETLATEVLSTCVKFPGRVDNARAALKKPIWDAGVAIDAAFKKFGTQMIVRSLTGPAKDRRSAPFTLAEQINAILAAYKDEKDRKIREKAQAEADELSHQAKVAEDLARAGSSTVTFDDAAEAAGKADDARAVVHAPAAALSRSAGSDFGSASRKRVRTFTIVDAALIPRHLCVPSDTLIREAIGKADGPMPVIPGLLIEDVSDLNRR